jgi:polyribonucleotide nucleotidyltransferase
LKDLSYEILAKALEQARTGRLHILGRMTDTISEPSADLKPHAPRIEQIRIPKDMIGAIIGPGGKIIQDIQAKSNTTIVVEEIDNFGYVDVFADNKDSIDIAMRMIKGIIAVPEAGTIYKGKIKSIVSFGAFVEIFPGKKDCCIFPNRLEKNKCS